MSRFKLLAFLAFVLLVSVPSGTAQAQTPASVNVSQNAEYGDILVDANGMTLYLFTNDERNKSNCSGGCATAASTAASASTARPSRSTRPKIFGSRAVRTTIHAK